jgi:hypothetical protein
MIDRIRELVERPVRELPAGVALAVCALVIVFGALLISQLGDSEPPGSGTGDGPDGGDEVTHPPVASHDPLASKDLSIGRATPADIQRIRRTTRRFLAAYLPYSYGRGEVDDIGPMTPVLAVLLREKAPRPPRDADRRDPRVELVHLEYADATEAETTALIDDGVIRYTLHVRLTRTGPHRWVITRVGPA